MLLMCLEVLAVLEVLDMKYGSEFKHGFTNCDCLHSAILKALHNFLARRTHKSRDMRFFFQNVQNEIFKIFKMFKRQHEIHQSSLLNPKISNKDKNTTLIIFVFCHYCCSLLWGNYWKSLKSHSHLSKKIVLFGSIKAL